MTSHETGVDARAEELLRSGFEAELGALMPSASPDELIIGTARRIRRRRHVAGGGLAALSAAGVSLGLVATGAFGAARPTASPATTTAPAAQHAITANTAAYDTAHGLVGSGTIGALPWHAALTNPAASVAKQNYQVDLGTAGTTYLGGEHEITPAIVGDSLPLAALSRWDFQTDDTSFLASHHYVLAGAVPSDVGSVVIDYADGESVTYPAIVEGSGRSVAFPGGSDLDVDRITVYSVQGKPIAYSIPANTPSIAPYQQYLTWHQTGRPLPPQGSVTFSGTLDGEPYKLRLTVNLIGVCADLTHAGPDEPLGCATGDVPPANAATFEWGQPYQGQVIYGYADPAVAKVTLTLRNSTKTVPMTVVSKLGLTFWSGVLPAGTLPGWITTYDAQGKVLESATTTGG